MMPIPLHLLILRFKHNSMAFPSQKRVIRPGTPAFIHHIDAVSSEFPSVCLVGQRDRRLTKRRALVCTPYGGGPRATIMLEPCDSLAFQTSMENED